MDRHGTSTEQARYILVPKKLKKPAIEIENLKLKLFQVSLCVQDQNIKEMAKQTGKDPEQPLDSEEGIDQGTVLRVYSDFIIYLTKDGRMQPVPITKGMLDRKVGLHEHLGDKVQDMTLEKRPILMKMNLGHTPQQLYLIAAVRKGKHNLYCEEDLAKTYISFYHQTSPMNSLKATVDMLNNEISEVQMVSQVNKEMTKTSQRHKRYHNKEMVKMSSR